MQGPEVPRSPSFVSKARLARYVSQKRMKNGIEKAFIVKPTLLAQ